MTSVTLIRRIAARPSIVFEALTTPEGLASWFGPDGGPVLIAESDPRIGGRFRVRFRMLDNSEHECSGEYLEITPPERLVMSWRWLGGEEDPNVSRLSFALKPTTDGVELTLTHSMLATAEARQSHEEGWTGALDKLVARYQEGKVR